MQSKRLTLSSYHLIWYDNATRHSVNLRWISRHKGFEGYKKVDQLAKEEVFKTPLRVQSHSVGLDGQQPIFSELGQNRISIQMDSFQVKPMRKLLFRDPIAH